MSDPSHEAIARAMHLSAMPWVNTNPREGVASGTARTLREIWSHRELLGLLTRRELKARYKDSALGFLWSLARPLTQLLIYYVVVGQFLGAARGIEAFAIYIFAGLTIYTLFSEIVSTGTNSIVSNGGLVKKVYLPREIFPLATIGSALFNFGIQLVILLVAAAIGGTLTFGIHLLWSVGSLAVVLIYATAAILVLGALNVVLRDIQYLVDVLLLLMMWASPIVYSVQAVAAVAPDWIVAVYVSNPITIAVLGFQAAFWGSNAWDPGFSGLAIRMGICLAVGVVLLFLALRYFSKRSGDFAQAL